MGSFSRFLFFRSNVIPVQTGIYPRSNNIYRHIHTYHLWGEIGINTGLVGKMYETHIEVTATPHALPTLQVGYRSLIKNRQE